MPQKLVLSVRGSMVGLDPSLQGIWAMTAEEDASSPACGKNLMTLQWLDSLLCHIPGFGWTVPSSVWLQAARHRSCAQ